MRDLPAAATWFGGLAGVVGGVMSTLQLFFGYEKQVELHRSLADDFVAIERRCTSTLAAFADGAIDAEAVYEAGTELSGEYNDLLRVGAAAPTSRKDDELARTGIRDGEEEYTERELSMREN